MARTVRRGLILVAAFSLLAVAWAPPVLGGITPFVASVTVIKVTDPASDPQDFAFSGTGPIDNGFGLDTDAGDGTYPSQAVFGITAQELGAAGILENAATGWTLTNVQCSGDTEASIVGAQVTLDIDALENIICTFTNTKVAAPTDAPTASPTQDQGGRTEAATEPGTDTEEKPPASGAGSGLGIAIVALVLLGGVLLITRPKRSRK